MKYSLLVMSLVFFVGCGSKDINLDERPPKQNPIPKTNKKFVKPNAKGSLYTREGTSLFADKKDLLIGDILQVNISEALTNDTSNSRALTKANDAVLGGGVITPLTGVTPSNDTNRITGRFNKTFGIGFNSSSSSSFSGSVASTVDESFETIISVVITDIYQNGNYFIKGSKELLINDQKQAIIVSGVIRPYDISPDNTINSSQIANFKLLYEKDGDETDTLEKPWGTRILETIWPF